MSQYLCLQMLLCSRDWYDNRSRGQKHWNPGYSVDAYKCCSTLGIDMTKEVEEKNCNPWYIQCSYVYKRYYVPVTRSNDNRSRGKKHWNPWCSVHKLTADHISRWTCMSRDPSLLCLTQVLCFHPRVAAARVRWLSPSPCLNLGPYYHSYHQNYSPQCLAIYGFELVSWRLFAFQFSSR